MTQLRNEVYKTLGKDGVREPVVEKAKHKDRGEAKTAKKRKEVTISKSGKKKCFIISSVVEGAPIVWDFVRAMELYSKLHDAEISLLWMRGVYKKDTFSNYDINQIHSYLTTKIQLNENLEACDFELAPAKGLPLGGRITKLGARETSVIVASTKQHMEAIPCSPLKTPHCMWSTGTVSVPKYSETEVGALAKQENTLGALIVEIVDRKKFFIRPVQWIDNGFVDLGVKYTARGTKTVKTKAMVFGDLHLGEEDPKALNTAIEQAKYLKAENIILHDLGSFNSISHHLVGKCVSRTQLPEHINTLEKELNYIRTGLKGIVKSFKKNTPEFYVVRSNHDAFLNKYLESGYFVQEPLNAKIGAKLFIEMCDGQNVLEKELNTEHVHFLNKHDTLNIEGVELSMHGHEGASGARGNTGVFFKNINRCIIGHQHKPGIRGGCFVVGTLSKLQLPYMSGLSAWLHANAAVYEGGHIQLIVYVGDNWRAQ